MEGPLFRGSKVTSGRGFAFPLVGRNGVVGSIFVEALALRKRLISRHGNPAFPSTSRNITPYQVFGEAVPHRHPRRQRATRRYPMMRCKTADCQARRRGRQCGIRLISIKTGLGQPIKYGSTAGRVFGRESCWPARRSRDEEGSQ
jgi:hypothetical protein